MGQAGTVVILAAGQGTRMRFHGAKVLHPLCGRPMLGYVLDQARALGAERILVVTGHGGDQVREWVESVEPDLRVRFVAQGEQLGTGHAVLVCLDELVDYPAILDAVEDLLGPDLLAGETLYDIRMFRDFMAAGALGMAQPDVLKLGGVGCWMEVAALARAFGLPVVPAGFDLMQIDAHLMAAIPHGLMMEHIPWLGPIFERPVRIEGGFALVPQEPGIGTDIRAEAIERYGVA